mmetsp:Transcript_37569/g.99166  ORF Transcript_37569/g.99166 Transcript_37569/m.99166 type:complete len:369 (-) Transcript_37569:13-1119(-)
MLCCSGLSYCGSLADDAPIAQAARIEEGAYTLSDGAGLRPSLAEPPPWITGDFFAAPRLLGRASRLQALEVDYNSDHEFVEPCAEPEPSINCGCSLGENVRRKRRPTHDEKSVEAEQARPGMSPQLDTLPNEVPQKVQLIVSPKCREQKRAIWDTATMTSSREVGSLAGSEVKEMHEGRYGQRRGRSERCQKVESTPSSSMTSDIDENPSMLYPWEVEMSKALGGCSEATAGDGGADMKAQAFSTRRGTASSFFVELQRQGACPIGIETRALLSQVTGALKVESVRSTGLIADWNKSMQLQGGHQVRAGDFIIEVNGISGSSQLLYNAFSQPGPLTLLVMRTRPGRRRHPRRSSSSTRASSDEELTGG